MILAANGLPHLLAELAAWRLGAIAVPVFAGWGDDRLAALTGLIEPVVVVADAPMAKAASVLQVTAASVLALAQGSGPGALRPTAPDDPCLVLFTSGSSGTPRGVTLSHDNLCSQQAAFASLWPEIGPGDRLAAYLPWHHSFGALAERLWALVRGATLTVVPGGGRDREAFLATVAAVQPTVFMSVPKLHGVLVASDAVPTSLRWVFTAGAPLPDEPASAYARHGIPVYEGWGLTETSPSAVITPPGRLRRAGVVGEPIPGVAVGVTDDGRVLVRGPNVMLGYWRDQAATDACLTIHAGQRVIDSGDLGEWASDGLRLLGRRDQQLKLANGEKVAAAAREAALTALPGVRHAVVGADAQLFAVVEVDPDMADETLLAAIAGGDASALPWERLGALYRLTAPLRLEDGQLTASLKVARASVLAQLADWRTTGRGPFRRLR